MAITEEGYSQLTNSSPTPDYGRAEIDVLRPELKNDPPKPHRTRVRELLSEI
jgi:hypothetical protein